MSGTRFSADVVPACLSFLAIYNPTLSNSDESVRDQIVYYYGKDYTSQKERKNNVVAEFEENQDELNERLRQVGLAQGMVQFGRDFADGEAVDAIETEKSRIVVHNLEGDWWLLASLDFTRIPSPPEAQMKNEDKTAGILIEYSAREVAPPALLLQQLLRAHQIFLLHQASSLAELWDRVPRQKFCSSLTRFWDSFIWNWDVLLHGNPAVDIYNGLKLSAGGELGIGVGEEEWGSGEREILEGFIGRTEGLVDLVVSRFGAPLHGISNANLGDRLTGGYGMGEYPGPADGVIFSGTGALTRSSIRNISSWMEWLYIYGETTHGVRDNPSSPLRRKREKPKQRRQSEIDHSSNDSTPIGIPASIISPPNSQRRKSANTHAPDGIAMSDKRETVHNASAMGTETFVKYLTLGVYGSQWGIPSARPAVNERLTDLRSDSQGSPSSRPARSPMEPDQEPSSAYFLLGLLGELEEGLEDNIPSAKPELNPDREAPPERSSSDNRIIVRTLYVERNANKQGEAQNDVNDSVQSPFFDKLRVVVYVQQPFIFTFLFEVQTDMLAMPSFYRSLHHQLGPLQRSLLTSTSPSKISQRLWEAASPRSTDASKSTEPISDLVFDPRQLTVHTTIPNIPKPMHGPAPSSAVWTRAEAMTVHSQIINTYTSTRRNVSEMERTCKTSRGWWVVWMCLSHPPTTSHSHPGSYREAFLIRKASDYITPTARKSSGRYVSSSSNDGLGWGSPSKLAEGIGIDARQYIEGLLSLNR